MANFSGNQEFIGSGGELTTAEETIVQALSSLANSASGEFIRKESGAFVNTSLSETIALAGLSDVAISSPSSGQVLRYNGSSWANSAVTGTGTVTSISVATFNGVSGTVATATTTPVISLSLGAITPTSVAINGGTALTTSNQTGTGNIVLATSPTLVTPALGTPASGTLTNCTGLPVAGITASTSTALGVGSIELGHASDTTIARSGAGAITVEGTAVLLSGGALGTPSSGTLTNCTGLPVAGLVALTASEIVGTTAGGVLVSLAVATYPSLTELTYVKGVTSAIQTQIDTKVTSGGALGTPSSGTGTNITGIPAANILAGSFGAGAYVISTSLQAATIELGHATDTTIARVSAGVISVEGVEVTTLGNTTTGTGSIVRASSPALVTPALGTPASGVATNITGLVPANIVAGTLAARINLGEGADTATIGLEMDASMSADERYSGITVPGTAGATLAFGDICYLDVTATEWLLADASAAATAGSVVLGICVDASTDGAATSMLLTGTVRSAAFPASIALGAPVYVSETAGDITVTQPTTTDAVIRVCGWAVTVEPNTIYFNPSSDYITHT